MVCCVTTGPLLAAAIPIPSVLVREGSGKLIKHLPFLRSLSPQTMADGKTPKDLKPVCLEILGMERGDRGSPPPRDSFPLANHLPRALRCCQLCGMAATMSLLHRLCTYLSPHLQEVGGGSSGRAGMGRGRWTGLVSQGVRE